MGESHTRGTLSWRPVTPEAGGGGPSAMARASYGRPFKPYAYGGGDKEPAAVIAARERHRALNAEIARARDEAARRQRERAAEVMPDAAPGWEWYRELAEDQELAELAGTCDRYQAAMAAVPEPRAPDPLPPPVTAASRCGRCGYLTSAAGHRVMCDE